MENEVEKVRVAIEDFGKKVVEAVKRGKGEADKVTKTAQIKIEMGSLNRQIKDLYLELGEQFYKNLKKPTKKGGEEVAETVGQIEEVEKNMNSLKRTLKAIKDNKPVPAKGRPRKAEGEDKAPKRRGRPPKSAGAASPKKRGRPSKAAAQKAPAAAPKRRGRPPKSATVS